MKHLNVPFVPVEDDSSVAELSQHLDKLERNGIENIPWPAYNYKPEVCFVIAYNKRNVLLKFYVNEDVVRAIYSNPNDPVYKDSCVEFFIAFENEPEYYNFEFNCAGTCLLGFGKEREDRILLPVEVIRLISFQALLKPAGNREASIGWQLTLRIPFPVFHYHQIITLKGKKCRVNFFKCGDDLPKPCFLAWNNIETVNPDFHAPDYFGSLQFT